MNTITHQKKVQAKLCVALLVASLGWAGGMSAADETKGDSVVKVTFVDPEKFTDVREDWGSGSLANDRHREFVLGELKTYFEKTVTPYLGKGQSFEITVTDLDLAGDFEPWRGMNFDSVRIVKDLYPPRMKLAFRLLGAEGAVIREGDRKLIDMSFLMTVSLSSHDPLRYDKEMIRTWVRQEFKQPNRSS
jgi:hypothetical protein